MNEISSFCVQFCREFYKLATKRPRVNTPKAKNVANRLSTQLEQQPRSNVFNGINNEVNPPEVLTHHDSIDPRESRPRDKKQGNRKLNLSGDVDLGTNSLKENRRRKVTRKNRTTTTTTTTERSNELPIYPRMNHHRHHHNEHHQERQQEFIIPETTTPREFSTTTATTTTTTPWPTTTTPATTTSTTTTTTPRPRPTPTTTTEAYEPEPETTTRRPQPTTTTPEPYYEPTTLSTTTMERVDEQETTTLSIRAQKAARIAKLRERLANLSPEDQKEYIRMKLLRSKEKKQQNETIP